MKEIERLSQMPPMAPEVGIIRTYLDWILDLPWEHATEDNLDVKHAAKVLEQYHYGLGKAKDRILEYIAVRSLKPKAARQPILCFVGPPGTGKTSLGIRSPKRWDAISCAFRWAACGTRPKSAGTGAPTSARCPGGSCRPCGGPGRQPAVYAGRDRQAGRRFPRRPVRRAAGSARPGAELCLFATIIWSWLLTFRRSCSSPRPTRWTIPPALLDRMEVIEFPGYIEEEKLEIADRFLIPRQMEESGLEENEICSFSDQALRRIIREYTYEAGVRNLEREIGRMCRKVARLKAEKKRITRPAVAPRIVEKFLGPPQFFQTEAERQDEVGVATGDGLDRERRRDHADRSADPGRQGQPADHRPDRRCDAGIRPGGAFLYQIARRASSDLNPEVFERLDIHIHMPEGAIPKDGPSAGITMATALISAFTERQVYKDVGMTGEITLRGRVLPIGGVREKILAAHRAGLKTVIMPGTKYERPGGCAQEGADRSEDRPGQPYGPGARGSHPPADREARPPPEEPG